MGRGAVNKGLGWESEETDRGPLCSPTNCSALAVAVAVIVLWAVPPGCAAQLMDGLPGGGSKPPTLRSISDTKSHLGSDPRKWLNEVAPSLAAPTWTSPLQGP